MKKMMIRHFNLSWNRLPLAYPITLLVLIIFQISLIGQTSTPPNFPESVVPPSPNAAALGKYGDIPVSLYTGTPNISVPLYNLKSKKMSVPVSLSYHASGIKVDDVASNVGLGWSLKRRRSHHQSGKGLTG